MARNDEWTAAEDQHLLGLWRDGSSMAEIAVEFSGRSRNACIGRIKRLRERLGVAIVRSGRQGRAPLRMKKKRVRRKTNFAIRGPSVIVAPTPEKRPALPPAARQLSLLELGPKDCRFIVSGAYTRQHLYCAADATGNVDEYGNNCYCTYHRRLMRAGVAH